MLTFVFVVVANTEGWKTDEEFGRQRLAGPNPHVIKRIKVIYLFLVNYFSYIHTYILCIYMYVCMYVCMYIICMYMYMYMRMVLHRSLCHNPKSYGVAKGRD